MTKTFFVSTGDDMQFYDCEHKAREAAQEAIDDWNAYGEPEWPEDVEGVFWGEIREKATPVPAGENHQYINYVLTGNEGAEH